ncbi:MAG: UDP-N-acetylmuramoyl-L-alanine--D-glutamate ligase [Methylophaga sp.]|nr:MAG: UDP-N-acetylmuramoyl-L-alanine--D-glutamate ligase [Methylophaga sp.]
MNLMATKITQQSIVIVGLGQTGLSCARFLTQKGFAVAIMDSREQPPALGILQQEHPEIIVKTGGFDASWLQQADMIVLSPGVDPRDEAIEAAKQSGVEIVGDVELFARFSNAPIVAITGSNGKSTVTTLLAAMAGEAGKNCKIGGNLGTPSLDLISEPAPDFYIVELSSFQLETVSSLNAFVSTVLNISPDHMDRYNSTQDYQNTKAKIYSGDGVMVINVDDAFVNQLSRQQRNTITFGLDADFSVITKQGEQWLAEQGLPLIEVNKLKIIGKHNIDNALAALALGSAMALPMPAMLTALQQYSGLPHRCRLVGANNGVRWFNDSKATNVGACIAAIEGLANASDLILIAGGEAKDQDFSELTATLQQHVRAVILLGQDAQLMAASIPQQVELYFVTSLQQAVSKAKEIAKAGDNVLLSPACASFDMFSGYAERGDTFESLVKEQCL